MVEQQLLNYFIVFTRDTSSMLQKLKSTVYQLIKIDCPAAVEPLSYTSDINSIIKACNRSYQQLRWIQSLLRGHLTGRDRNEELEHDARSSIIGKQTINCGKTKDRLRDDLVIKKFTSNHRCCFGDHEQLPLNMSLIYSDRIQRIIQKSQNTQKSQTQPTSQNEQENDFLLQIHRNLRNSQSEGHLELQKNVAIRSDKSSNRSNGLLTSLQLVRLIKNQLNLKPSI